MIFRPDRLGLIGFIAVFIFAFAFHGLGGSDGPSQHPQFEPAEIHRRPSVVRQDQVRRPAPSVPSKVLPPASKSDPTVQIQPQKKGNSMGTAFSIGDGVWMTARHVLTGCAAFGIVTGHRNVERGFGMILNPDHDLAIFKTKRGTAALGFERAALNLGQDAFHFGYPQGKPTDVRSSLLGRLNVTDRSRHGSKEPVLVWAETRRVPDLTGTLGGMSGGPVVDGEGDIIGVSVAEAPRRGRIFTAAPMGIRHMLDLAGLRPRQSSRGTIADGVDRDGFPRIGAALRKRLTVAQVVCWVD